MRLHRHRQHALAGAQFTQGNASANGLAPHIAVRAQRGRALRRAPDPVGREVEIRPVGAYPKFSSRGRVVAFRRR